MRRRSNEERSGGRGDEAEWMAEHFDEQRTHLRAVAYRMLGSLTEADDALQEAWLRVSRADASAIENLGGWLTTIVTRVCLNMLRSRGTRREDLMGPYVPDPIVAAEGTNDPEAEALLADSVGLALNVVLETLTPAERLAFVLHDMFAVPFDEIAPMVGRSPDAARQLASRARRRVQGSAAVPDADAGASAARWSTRSSPRRGVHRAARQGRRHRHARGSRAHRPSRPQRPRRSVTGPPSLRAHHRPGRACGRGTPATSARCRARARPSRSPDLPRTR